MTETKNASQRTNPIESVVQQAPSVVPELELAENQKREDALHTMAVMEEARAGKGNFCLTLGAGDKRAVLLIEPYETIENTRPDLNTLRHDYVLLTGDGIRRISFLTPIDSPISQNYNERVFKRHVEGGITGDPTLKNSVFEERTENGVVNYSLVMGAPDSHKGRLQLDDRYHNLMNDATGSCEFGVATNPNMVTQVLYKSMGRARALIQNQTRADREQTGMLGTMQKTIK